MKKLITALSWHIRYFFIMNIYKEFDCTKTTKSYLVLWRKETTLNEDGTLLNSNFGGRQVCIMIKKVTPGYLKIFKYIKFKTKRIDDISFKYYYNPLKKHWPAYKELPYDKRGNNSSIYLNLWVEIKERFNDFDTEYRKIDIVSQVPMRNKPLLSLLNGWSTIIDVEASLTL